MIDQNVALATSIGFQVTQEDLHNIDVDVVIAEATDFEVTEGDMTHIDQSTTEEEIAEMAMAVDLEDEQHIDPFDNMEDDFAAWADLNESYDAFIQEQQQIVDQRRYQNRDRHTDDKQNGKHQKEIRTTTTSRIRTRTR